MSKGLEAWKLYQSCVEQECNDYGAKETIEKELKEWDYFDNELKKHHITKPFLKQFLDLLSICNSENGVSLVKFISENNVYDFRKKEKVFEVIKIKRVNVAYLIWCIETFDYKEGLALEQYNLSCVKDEWKLTQEEYDFLKEVLE